MQHWKNLPLLLLAILGMSNCFADEYFYRYKDKEGHTVITGTLPSDVADSGYEIISPRGNVIETVQPAKTKEELASEAKSQEAQKKADLVKQQQQKEAQEQARKDDILLKSFTSEEDIMRSRDEQIASIAILEQIMQQNIVRLTKQLNDAKATSVLYQKKGESIPVGLQKTIDDTQRQIKDNIDFLERKKVEKQDINTKYQAIIERFHKIYQDKSLPSH